MKTTDKLIESAKKRIAELEKRPEPKTERDKNTIKNLNKFVDYSKNCLENPKE